MKIIILFKKPEGLTLVELLAVIVVLGIIFTITVISLGGIKGKVERDVCTANRVELER
jgi:prepilin-type N-terminal cleavage/methylation domain-containing protein